MTLEELKNQYPALCAEMHKEGVAAGERQEKDRLQAIDRISAGIGDQKLIDEAKYGDKQMDAGQLAMAALLAQAKQGEKFLSDIQKDADTSGVKDVAPTPNAGWAAEDEEKRAALSAAIAKAVTKGVK
jgi:hypothetical protein